MAAWNVRFTDLAVQDVREAAAYMQDQLGAPRAALRFLDELEGKVDLLKSYPESCTRVRDYELYQKGYRWCAVGNFLMFFTTDLDDRLVTIERVLYGYRDWKSLL